MSLIQEYTRAAADSHFAERWKERVDNVQLTFPGGFFTAEEDGDTRRVIHSLVLAEIKKIVTERYATQVSTGQPEEPGKEYITQFANFTLKRGERRFEPILQGQNDPPKYAGSAYLAISNNNSWVTLILVTKDGADPSQAVKRGIEHIWKDEKRKVNPNDFEFLRAPKSFPTINVDELLDAHLNPPEPVQTGVKSPSDLPYKVKTEYRWRADKKTYFVHDEFGKGLVVASRDGGAMNIGRGKWEYIKVVFPGDSRPFREFNSLYTSIYFNHRTESRIRKLITQLFEQVS